MIETKFFVFSSNGMRLGTFAEIKDARDKAQHYALTEKAPASVMTLTEVHHPNGSVDTDEPPHIALAPKLPMPEPVHEDTDNSDGELRSRKTSKHK